METCDCHCHLYEPYFDKAELVLIKRSLEDKKRMAVVVCESEKEFSLVLNDPYYTESDNIKVCIGYHPVNNSGVDINFDELERLILESRSKICGIGEIGLDFSPHVIAKDENEMEAKQKQKEIFQKQIDLAKKHNLMINVHSRQASKYSVDQIEESNIKKVLLHAFDGKVGLIQRCIKLGYYFSISANIRRNDIVKRLAKVVPLENMVLESDSPALGPDPKTKSTPNDLDITIAELALIKQCPMDDIKNATMKNAKHLFNFN